MRRTRSSIHLPLCLLVAAACSGGTGDEPAAQTPPSSPLPAVTPTASPSVVPVDVPSDCPRSATNLDLFTVGARWADDRGRQFEPGEACLVAPAGEPFSVTVHNGATGVLTANHNFSIYADESRTQGLFNGDLVYPGESLAYDVPVLEAGAYLFACDIHPNDMTGVLVVEDGG